MCPEQWEYVSPDKNFSCYIRYRHDCLTVYISTQPVVDIIDCIKEENLVLSVDDLLDLPGGEHISDAVLEVILSDYDLLEKE